MLVMRRSIILALLLALVLSAVLQLAISTPTAQYPELKNKNVLITGGTAGIGLSTALEFARQGANVAILARDFRPDWYNGTGAVQLIRKQVSTQVNVQFYRVDVSDLEQVVSAVKNIEKDFGVIDVVINSAGIGGPMGYRLDQTPELYFGGEFDPIRNNLYGTLNVMHAVVNHWKRTKAVSGRETKSIINLSSYNGLRACATCSLYSASKHGIIGLTQSAAIEYSEPSDDLPRIRVNALCPGLINTPLTRNQVKFVEEGKQPWLGPLITNDSPLWQKYKPVFEKELVGKKLGEPEEMASIILFLSSNGASYMTGQVISGDFGFSAK